MVAVRPPRRYGAVLALVALTYLVSATTGAENQPFGVLLQVTTAWMALRIAEVRRASRTKAVVALAVIAATAVVASVLSATVIVLACSAILYVVAPVAILRHLALRPVVDGQTLSGAVTSYAMIGMLYAFGYQLCGVVQSGGFFQSGVDPTTDAALFFSFTTLTTTGYGNLVPAGNPGQSLAVSEMMLGQLFLVTVIAKVVSGLDPRSFRRRRVVGGEEPDPVPPAASSAGGGARSGPGAEDGPR